MGNNELFVDNSTVWKSPPSLPVEVVPRADLLTLLGPSMQKLINSNNPSGCGILIPALMGWTAFENIPMRSSLAATLGNRIQRLFDSFTQGDGSEISNAALMLIGLGEGLTPSGDDFLGGLFFCLNLLVKAYPDLVGKIWNYSEFIIQCRSHTNRISYSILADHADGHSIEAMQRFSYSLFSGFSPQIIRLYAEKVIPTGHSTGWDILTGFTAGIAAISTLN